MTSIALTKKFFSSSSDSSSGDIILDLSGEKLRYTLESLLKGCENRGGIEAYITTLKAKSDLFRSVLLPEEDKEFSLEMLAIILPFMPTVRRKILPELKEKGAVRVIDAIGTLVKYRKDTTTVDEQLKRFREHLPADGKYRWVRDLAAEILHYLEPEKYPLMTRWVWDFKANTGVLRELWFGEDIDQKTIKISDKYEVFLSLREELTMFLTQNGFYRDVHWYSDLIQAQTYADYIASQGGTYLRADFNSLEDPMEHTRRMLGLDGAKGVFDRSENED